MQMTSLVGNPERLYVWFTGRQTRQGYTADYFQWMETARSMGYDAVFLRDTGNDYYQDETLLKEMLRSTVTDAHAHGRKVIFVGLSMGGWAAIDYGRVCKPDKIITFTPAPPHTHEITVPDNTHIYFCKDSTSRIGDNGLNDLQSMELFKGATFYPVDGDIHGVQLILRQQGLLEGILNDV